MNLIPTMLISLATVVTVGGDSMQKLDVPGVVEPISQVTVLSMIEGRVASIEATESQFVEKDEVLFRLDDDLAIAEVNMAEVAAQQTGKLNFAQAELARAESMLARLERVVLHHAIAAKDLEEARSNVEKAKSNLKVAEDEVTSLKLDAERARIRLEEFTVKAPFSGIVSRIRISTGQVVQRQTVVMTIVDINRLRVELSVPLENFEKLSVGQAYALPVESPVVKQVSAVLIAIDPVLNAGTNTARCVFEIANEDRKLPAGFLAYPPHFEAASSLSAAK